MKVYMCCHAKVDVRCSGNGILPLNSHLMPICVWCFQASSHVSDDMSLTRQDVVQRLAQAMSLPTANRFFNFWRVYMMRARVMVEDTTRLYPLICAGMGSTPCGLKALAKVSSLSHYFIHGASPNIQAASSPHAETHPNRRIDAERG